MPEPCRYEDAILHMSEQVEDIHSALMGTLDNPDNGLMTRVSKLESWRVAYNSRVKSYKAVGYAILSAFITAVILANWHLIGTLLPRH